MDRLGSKAVQIRTALNSRRSDSDRLGSKAVRICTALDPRRSQNIFLIFFIFYYRNKKYFFRKKQALSHQRLVYVCVCVSASEIWAGVCAVRGACPPENEKQHLINVLCPYASRKPIWRTIIVASVRPASIVLAPVGAISNTKTAGRHGAT